MSRIGKLPISVPAGVTVTLANGIVSVKGPKGDLQGPVHARVTVTIDGPTITVTRGSNVGEDRALHGLTRAMINNMIVGVTKGFEKKLELNGVGFRGQVQGKKLNLQLGFSHPVVLEAPEGITFKIEDNIITVSGSDRQAVGEISAHIRSYYEPEPYKGKGIRYSDEHVARKEGKRVAGAGA